MFHRVKKVMCKSGFVPDCDKTGNDHLTELQITDVLNNRLRLAGLDDIEAE